MYPTAMKNVAQHHNASCAHGMHCGHDDKRKWTLATLRNLAARVKRSVFWEFEFRYAQLLERLLWRICAAAHWSTYAAEACFDPTSSTVDVVHRRRL